MTNTLLHGEWVTDAGLETDLIFNHGVDLPEFASFPLVDDADGAALLTRYYDEFARIADDADAGLLLETPTWRSSGDWGAILGYDAASLDRINRDAVALVRAAVASSDAGRVRVSGCVGPLGDGYLASDMTADAAAEQHAPRIRSLVAGGADLVHAMTMTTAAEAIGVVLAARDAGTPVAISFTVETDGRLPDGSTAASAFDAVEAAAPADWYGLNCAHPTHAIEAIDGGDWQQRLTFFRPNASTMSHAELDEMEVLDDGDIPLLVSSTTALRAQLPEARVIGGCCGTDSRHVAALWGVSPAAR